jgi:hypothetical protein
LHHGVIDPGETAREVPLDREDPISSFPGVSTGSPAPSNAVV